MVKSAKLATLAAAISAVPVSATAPSTNPQSFPRDLAVHHAAKSFMSDPCHVGLSIGITDHGRRSFYNFGSTSKAKAQLPTRRSLYEIGSITKTFVGALAARALLEGKMTLDGDFRGYLGRAYPNLQLNGKPVTLRSLAMHTSGLPRDIPDNSALFVKPDFEKLPYLLIAQEKHYDTSRYLRELRNVQLTSEPGTKTTYSNFGIKLIAFGLEHIRGQSFETILRREITGPLQINDTALVLSPRQRARLVQGYSPAGKPAPHILRNSGAAGGLISSTDDLVKYAEWQMDDRDRFVAKAHQPLGASREGVAEGLIWNMSRGPSGRKLWHSGGVFGMSSDLILFPDHKRAYALLANDACLDTQQSLDNLAAQIEASAANP